MIGRTLSHYEILDEISRGGMGIVYRARDVKLERDVAVKVLPPELVSDEDRKRRFVQEARAASKLGHSRIAVIHEIDESDGVSFIAMELIEGEQLSERIARAPIPTEEALRLAEEIAEGIAHAHDKGIVHRDLKPDNVMLTGDGHVKIIDFGLAKLVEPKSAMSSLSSENSDVQTEVKGTVAGQLLGTVSHMSPEQARGQKIDHRSDIFSFGIVLQEILTGKRPFKEATGADTISAILNRPAPRLGAGVGERAQKTVQSILDRLLNKDPDERYQSMRYVAEALSESRRELVAGPPAFWKQPFVALAATALLVGLGGLALLSMYRGGQARWAREEAIPKIESLVEKDDYVAAYTLAMEAERAIPNDPLLASLWDDIVVTGTIETTPDGARIYSKPYEDVDGKWELLGESPLVDVRLPRGIFRWRFEKDGFTPREVARRSRRGVMTVTLTAEGDGPEGMELVPAGEFAVPLNGFAPTEGVELGAFWVDQHEVTNRQYKEFVDNGGYQKREFWMHNVVQDGQELSWEEAMTAFRDTTGRAGPATWELGDFADGHGEHPVSGVSWYEAAAYAEFRGASLPTIYHWSKAALSEREVVQPISPSIVPLSNFGGETTAPVGRHAGVGPYGTFDMAGNVREWCANEWNDAERHAWVLGGAWNDPDYMFTVPYHLPPADRSSQNGFRLVRYVDPVADALQASLALLRRDYDDTEPVSDEVFEAFERIYTYSRSELNPTVESIDETAPGWIREEVHLDTSNGEDRIPLLLFVPKEGKPPYQVVVRFPGLGAFANRRSHENVQLGPTEFLVRSGRAVVQPIYQGSYGRFTGVLGLSGDAYLRAFREHMVQWREDLGRTLDYLNSRPEIDAERIAYFGTSFGGSTALPLLVLEERLDVAILLSGGLPYRALPAEGDAIDFVPRITLPMLMLNGAYDYIFPLETRQKPMFELLGTPLDDKRHIVYEAGHFPLPRSQMIQESLAWLDRYLGPID